MAGRSEARVSVTIWDDPDFVALTADAQRMYLFLISQPDLAHDGVIPLRERRWARSAAGMTVSDIASGLKELEQANYVVIDEDTEELLIRSLIRRDRVYRQPYVLKSAHDHLQRVASLTILAALRAELERVRVADDLIDKSATTVDDMLAFINGRLPKGPTEAIANPTDDPAGEPFSDSTDTPSVDPSEKGLVDPSVDPSEKGLADPSEPVSGERGGVRRVSSDSPSPSPHSPLLVSADADAPREDVKRICLHLAAWIERNGSKAPRDPLSKRWTEAARLLIDVDGRTVEQIERAIDWCQQDDFWRSNILSMPKLRERYDQIRLAAQRKQARTPPASVYRNPTTDDAYEWRPPR